MFNDDGGFFSEGQGGYGGSTTTPKSAAADKKRAEHLLPVNTHQIRQSDESGVIIAGQDFHLLTLVGKVKSIETSSLKVTYVIEDDRGCVEALHWIEPNYDLSKLSVVENVYCRIYGSIRTQENKKFLMVFNIKAIEDLNEITTHRLEVAVFAKKVELSAGKQLNAPGTSMDVDMNGKMGDLGNSLMNGGYHKSPMTNHQRMVFAVIKKFAQDPGIHVNEIANHLPNKLPQATINKIVEDLMNEGHIYSSIDEFHFLSTESA